MSKITAKQADKMYEDWRKSGSKQDFAEFYGLDFWELAEIHNAYMDDREKREADGQK